MNRDEMAQRLADDAAGRLGLRVGQIRADTAHEAEVLYAMADAALAIVRVAVREAWEGAADQGYSAGIKADPLPMFESSETAAKWGEE